jgi:hypothetical protein
VTAAAEGEVEAEFEEAEQVCGILVSEIEMLTAVIEEHTEGCSSRDEAKLERAVLTAALTYYETKVSRLGELVGGADLQDERVLADRQDGSVN